METPDYIIIGGGSAGCVLANRISANSSSNVLLLEAGGQGKGWLVDMPSGVVKLLGDSERAWRYPTLPDSSAAGRAFNWTGGKMLGGGSSINGTVYFRGQKSDFNDWESSGARGWSFDDVLPYFRKAETYWGPVSQDRGRHGPLQVSPPNTVHPLTYTFLTACSNMSMPVREEYNSGDISGCFLLDTTTYRGRRSSTRKDYLQPVIGRQNLKVMTRYMVERILIGDGRATGVRAHGPDGPIELRAKREVILSAGAIASPAILMRSGIGPAKELAALGIHPIVHSPNVGRNLQENGGVTMSKFVNVPTYNSERGLLPLARNILLYVLARKGALTSSAAQANAYMKTREGLAAPDLKFVFLPYCVSLWDGVPQMSSRPGVTIGVNPTRPLSRGRITLQDASIRSTPKIDHQLVSNSADMDILVYGLQVAEKLFSTSEFAKYTVGNNEPARIPLDRAGWEDFIRNRVGIGFHPVGTCRMGEGPDAVVSSKLQVFGVERLRVVDASVMPNIVSGPTNATTIMIAEKASELIMQER